MKTDTNTTDPTPSRGHVCFVDTPSGRAEYYRDDAGAVYRAPVHNVIDVTTGFRHGRWECDSWQAEAFLARVRDE